jgi:hypothetical protein
MKRNLHIGSLILVFSIFFTVACKKSTDVQYISSTVSGGPGPRDTTSSAPTVPYPVNPTQECNNAPYYGDSILYPQPGNGDFYVYNQNSQGLNGTYLSWPAGLVMNSTTGAIDLTQSQTGARYDVAFVQSGTTDTCMSQVIIAGAAYMDSVYVLSQNENTAEPYFNANPYAPSPCTSNGGKGCDFDYNHAAQNQGVVIDHQSGNIDLEKTMQKSLFHLLPVNGTTVYSTIYYKLDDNSNNAPQNIQVKFVYYNHLSDVPNSTLLTITDHLLNTLDDLLLSKGPSTRPPYIIIVRDAN